MSKAQPIITDNNGRDNKGRFAPGNIGRPTGSQNTSTIEINVLIQDFLMRKEPDLEKIYEELQPKDKVNMYIALSKLILPKQTEEIKHNNEPDLSGLSTAELIAILEKAEECQ
ncbi:MAG: hypothetical protein ACK47F_13170 [Flavobacteriales bacterium]